MITNNQIPESDDDWYYAQLLAEEGDDDMSWSENHGAVQNEDGEWEV